jgi:hypothetical protein
MTGPPKPDSPKPDSSKSKYPPRSRRLPAHFDRAAEQRARGASWLVAAGEVGVLERTVRKWAARFPAEWRRAMTKWAAAVAREAAAESVYTLRTQLRSADENVVRAAADSLIQYALARAKVARSLKALPGSALSPEATALAEFLEGLTHDEHDAILERLRPAAADAGAGDSLDAAIAALARRSE